VRGGNCHPNSNCTEILCIDDKELLQYCLGSSLGAGKITKNIRNITPFYSYTKFVLTGINLSDSSEPLKMLIGMQD
jgi:hypothetical protein